MEETKKYIQAFLSQNKIEVPPNKLSLFDEFIANETNINSVRIIQENQKMMMLHQKQLLATWSIGLLDSIGQNPNR